MQVEKEHMRPTQQVAAASAEADTEARPRRTDKPLIKRKGVKGPNPLSMKKKASKRKAPAAVAPALAAATAGAVDEMASRPRRPRRRPKATSAEMS